MKLLVVASTVDLKFRYGCTPAWWQLLKALYELGQEVIVAPYQGRDIETLWWRTYPNPVEWQAKTFTRLKGFVQRFSHGSGGGNSGGVRFVARHLVQPKWERHLLHILERERDVAAVILMGVPINQLRGLPSRTKQLFDVPVLCYDGDIPASLPSHGGFTTGFNIYTGADLSEYDAFLINSKGGVPILEAMGARRVFTLQYGVDPQVYQPLEAEQDIDIFFYGLGYEYRKEWMEWMLAEASQHLDSAKVALGGGAFGLDLGKTVLLGDIPFSAWRYYCARSKINLNITRSTHANLYATSTSRPFELAALGCCIVSNPYQGLEEWFQPGEELFVAHNQAELVDLYRWLLSSEVTRREAGRRARQRVLREHTFQHRARELLQFVNTLMPGRRAEPGATLVKP